MNRKQAEAAFDKWQDHVNRAAVATEQAFTARWNNGYYSPDGRLHEAIHELRQALDMIDTYREADRWLSEHG